MTARRFLLVAVLLACIWTIVIAITGGFVAEVGELRFSSRNPRAPLSIALICAAVYFWRHPRSWLEDARWLVGELRIAEYRSSAWRCPPFWPRSIAVACVTSALVAGIGWGSFIAGGPDASGYVSQADMWARGDLTLPAPDWARDAPWPYGVWSSAPIGYGPNHTNDAIVPMYSPGLPMMMALLQIVFGPPALYFVVPVLGALAVGATYLLGRRLGGEWAGAVAALLLLCSPAFLWMLVQPMSDVPVTACWAIALVLALRQRPVDAFAAGVATALAILVRPNIVPLAAFPALLLFAHEGRRMPRLALFGIAPAVAVAIIAALNWHYNGSPLQSGYGSPGQIYELDRIPANLQRYTTWLVDTQTPFVLLGLLAPLAVRRTATRYPAALIATAFPLVLLALYLPYVVFDHWPFLRFLLPGYPGLLAGVGVVLTGAVARLRQPRAAVVVLALVVYMATHGWGLASRENAFEIETFDRRYARIVDVVNRLPPNAVIVSNVHSGTVRFYAGRDVLRFEVMKPEDMDRALAYLHERGHPLYFVGDPEEVRYFKELFGDTRAVERFARGPMVDVHGALVYAFGE